MRYFSTFFEWVASVALPLWKAQLVLFFQKIRKPVGARPAYLIRDPFERYAYLALLLGFAGVSALWIDPLLLAFRHEWHPALQHLMGRVTQLGSSALYLVPAGLLLLSVPVVLRAESSKCLRVGVQVLCARLLFVFLSVAGSGLLVTALKRLIGRARPKLAEVLGALHFDPVTAKSALASFPSGHTTTAFAVAVVVVLFWRARWAQGVFLVAALVALSRIVLGAHHLSDIVGGALLGSAFVWLLARWMASCRLVFAVDAHFHIFLRGNKVVRLAIVSLMRDVSRMNKR